MNAELTFLFKNIVVSIGGEIELRVEIVVAVQVCEILYSRISHYVWGVVDVARFLTNVRFVLPACAA